METIAILTWSCFFFVSGVSILCVLRKQRKIREKQSEPIRETETEPEPAVSFGQFTCPRCRECIDRPESCYCPQCGSCLPLTPLLRIDGDDFVSELEERFGFECPWGVPWHDEGTEIDWKKLGASLGVGAVLRREELRARLLGLLMLNAAAYYSGEWLEDLLPELEEGMLLGAAKEQLVEGSQPEYRDNLLGDLAPTLSYFGRFVLPVGESESQVTATIDPTTVACPP